MKHWTRTFGSVGLAGLLLGFAGVGPAVFADGSLVERQILLAAVVIACGMVGLLLGFLSASWRGSLVLIAPAILIGLLLGEQQTWVLLFLVLLAASTLAAGYTGAMLKTRRSSQGSRS